MKVYSIKPNSYFVRVSDGRVLEFVDRTAPEVVVADVLGDEALAKKYLRFKWRWPMFTGWADPRTSDKAITENEVKEVIAAIDRASAENAAVAARADRERPDFVNDAGVHKKE